MTFSYLASFDFADRRHGFGSVTFTRSGGATFTLNLLTDVGNGSNSDGDAIRIVNHYPTPLTEAVAQDLEGSTGLRQAACTQSWGSLFQGRMRSAAATAGWSSSTSLTCTYDVDTMRYTFTYAGNFNSIVFSNLNTAWLFGFGADWSGSTTSVTGTQTPKFVIQPILSCVTMENQDGYNYEPGGISLQSVSSFGAVSGLTRSSVPVFRDWTQQSETRIKALRATQLQVPWSHEDLFATCRSVLPFIVVDGFGDDKDYVFKLRPDSAMFSSNAIRRAGGDMDDALFDVTYSTQLLGVFNPDDDEEVSGQLMINGFPVQINGFPVVING